MKILFCFLYPLPHLTFHMTMHLKGLTNLYQIYGIKLSPNGTEEFEEKEWTDLQGYYGHCTVIDKAIGNIFEMIRELNISKNAIVFFTYDSCEMMGLHGVKSLVKQVALDESIKVPNLISYPEFGKKYEHCC